MNRPFIATGHTFRLNLQIGWQNYYSMGCHRTLRSTMGQVCACARGHCVHVRGPLCSRPLSGLASLSPISSFTFQKQGDNFIVEFRHVSIVRRPVNPPALPPASQKCRKCVNSWSDHENIIIIIIVIIIIVIIIIVIIITIIIIIIFLFIIK